MPNANVSFVSRWIFLMLRNISASLCACGVIIPASSGPVNQRGFIFLAIYFCFVSHFFKVLFFLLQIHRTRKRVDGVVHRPLRYWGTGPLN